MSNKERAEQLRQRAAGIEAAAARSDDYTRSENELAEARRLRAEADRLDPRKASPAEPRPRVQLCVLCNKISIGQNWKKVEREMALCPDCEDATPEELRLAGRRLIHAANRIENRVFVAPDNIQASIRERLAERRAS